MCAQKFDGGNQRHEGDEGNEGENEELHTSGELCRGAGHVDRCEAELEGRESQTGCLWGTEQDRKKGNAE